jgi:transcriptional regulator with XRE-family HTH domain
MGAAMYSRIESGKTKPSLSTLEKIVKALGISLTELIQNDESMINRQMQFNSVWITDTDTTRRQPLQLDEPRLLNLFLSVFAYPILQFPAMML